MTRNFSAFFSRLLVCIGVIFFLLVEKDATATHAVGVDLSYECLGGNQYRFEVNLYIDCAGTAPAPNGLTINISSASCGINSSLTLLKTSSQEVSQICDTQIPNTRCNGGTLPGIEQYVYSRNFTLPAQCSDWVVNYSLNARNNAITNLQSPGTQDLYVEANIDNTGGNCNSSAQFTSLPVPYVCVNQSFSYNHSAVDPDGDSLVYTLINPMTSQFFGNGGDPIPYVPGFSPTNPMSVSGAFNFNPVTGQMEFTPDQLQQAVITVLIEEYDAAGNYKGSTMRDLQVVVLNCTNTPPTATGVDSSTTVFDYDVCTGTSFCFDIHTGDSDPGQVTTMVWNNGIPGATFTTSGYPLEMGTFCWTPTVNDIGSHFFTVSVADDACQIPGINTYTYEIIVGFGSDPDADAGLDELVCHGDVVNLSATAGAGATFDWMPTTGLSCTTCPNPTVTATNNNIYTVTASYPSGCTKSDDVMVSIAADPTVVVLPQSAAICTGGTATLAANTQIGNTFLWSTGETTEIINPTPTNSTTYYVTVTNAGGCTSVDSAVVQVSPPPQPSVCNNIYVTTTGTGTGDSPSDPTDLQSAISMAECNVATIKLGIGTYNIDNPLINISSYTTLEGGYDPGNGWLKSSLPGATTIYRTAANPEGPATAQRLVAMYISDANYFRLQDLTVEVADAPNTGQEGMSTYALHLSNCSDYDIVRCQFIAGDASSGPNGINGIDGAPGMDGNNGTDGHGDNTSITGAGGDGGAGGGAGGGVAGTGGVTAGCCGPGVAGGDGIASGTYRAGGGGGGGAGAGQENNDGASGGEGGGVNIGPNNTAVGTGGNGAGWLETANPGTNGADGANGVDGTDGMDGTAGSHVGGFYVPGTRGGDGTDGKGGEGGAGGGSGGGQECGGFCTPGSGNGGGGGGGGGEGGTGGTGGYAGGSSYAIYLDVNGANGKIIDCNLSAGAAGVGGAASTGGMGGTAGFPGVGGTVASGEVGAGGNGGRGGTGGNGGNGGAGMSGESMDLRTDGTALTTSILNFDLLNQPEIFVENQACTNTDIDFSSGSSAGWDLGGTSTNQTPTGSVVTNQYTDISRKDIQFGSDVYSGFANITLDGINIPDFNTSANPLGTDTFTLCVGDNADFWTTVNTANIFAWDFGGAVTPNTYDTATVSGLVFNTPGTFTIQIMVTTDCCGASNPVTATLIVEDIPTISITGNTSFCTGESTVITASSNGSTYSWVPNSSINTDTGAVVTVNPPATTNYVVTSYSQYLGCSNTETVTITVNETPDLTTSSTLVSCVNDGTASVTVTNLSGPFDYEWNDQANQTTNPAVNLFSGNYLIKVTDQGTGCKDSTYVFVDPGSSPLVYISNSTNVSCYEGSNGTATAVINNGTAPYNYIWTNTDLGGTVAGSGIGLSTITGLVAGNYNVSIVDNNTCNSSVDFSISEPDTSVFINSVDTINTTCDGNGSLLISADGGSGTFSYQWDANANNQTTTLATGLAIGSYDVTVTDINNCQTVGTHGIIAPPPISVSVSVTDASCNGSSDGQVSVIPLSGTSPYTYLWGVAANSQMASTATGLSAGIYDVTITDQGACSTVESVTLTEPAGASILSTTITDEACNLQDGAATISVVGGASPYTYLWASSAQFQTTATATALSAGVHNVTIFDSNLCEVVGNITVGNNPPIITITTAATAASCNGSSDGTGIVVGTTGQTPYTYTWSAGGQNTQTAVGLPAGMYTVTVTDNIGCYGIEQVTVTQPDAISVTATTTDVSCFGESDGIISLGGASGGVTPYNYFWSTGNTTILSTGLTGGTYTVTIQDANGCENTFSYTLTEPAQLTTTPGIVDLQCYAVCDGQVTLSSSGGTGPYNYVWGNGNPTGSANNLCAGGYSVTTTDSRGCTTTNSFTLTEPFPITMTFQGSPTTCFGECDGFAAAVAGGGTGTLQYNWSSPIASSTALATNLCAGTYGLTVSDGNGCMIDTTNFPITQPPVISVTAFSVTPSNCSLPDGAASVDAVSGGLGSNYTYEWSSGQTNNTEIGLADGTHTVTIYDPASSLPAPGCFIAYDIVVPLIPGPSINAIHGITSCNNVCDGVGVVGATSNGGSTSFTYQWGAGTGNQSGTTATGLCQGQYTVSVLDGNGCLSTTVTNISQPDIVAVTITPDQDTICNGLCTNLHAQAVGGNGGPYSFLWDNAQTGSILQVCPSTQTLYQVTATDVNGCESQAQFTSIAVYPPLQGFALGDNTICDGDATNISADAFGGDGGPYVFVWNNGAGVGQNIEVEPTTYPLPVDYIVTITDGCSPAVVDTITIDYFSTPTPLFTPDSFEGCVPYTTTIQPHPNSLQNVNSCIWTIEDGTVLNGCDAITHTFNTTGQHDVSLMAVSNDGCTGTYLWPDVIDVHALPEAQFVIDPNPTSMVATDISFEDQSQSQVESWSWIFYDTDHTEILGIDDVYNPTFTYPSNDTGTYPVHLMVSTIHGCTDDTTEHVKITGVFQLYVPTAFTPDGDGLNDYFFPQGLGFDPDDFRLMIFDRWGEKIFETRDVNEPWDGIADERAGTKQVQDGVYIWKLETRQALTSHQDPRKYVGTVTLLR